MRLLKIDSSDRITLTEDLLDNIPPYAILSHTWGADQDECTFQDMQNGTGGCKAGYRKISFCGKQAQCDGLEYFWVDSVCINKANYTELSEAINSMFRWYRQAQKCYVFLADVSSHKRDRDGETQRSWESAFRDSRWFTRGWTLQELLAPDVVEFYSREGDLLGSKSTLHDQVQEITGVPASALEGAALSTFTVPERMKWAASRSTKRMEDKVYCLLGIFDVFMSPIYGEGEHASVRLKDAIARSCRDHLDRSESDFLGSRASTEHKSPAARRSDLVESLRFEQMDSRRTTIKKAYSNTCEWLLVHPSYLSWVDHDKFHLHHGFLWINGKPGAGKSTLIKYAHANAENSRAKDEIILSFYFNARGSQLEKSTLGMYRALLVQLFEKVRTLQAILDERRFHPQKSNPETAWELNTIRELLSLCFARLNGQRVKCFIDALDECDEEDVRNMIEFWEELGQIGFENSNQHHVCFSSRHYPTIDIRFGCQLTLEDQTGHTEDLASYVQNHLHAGKGQLAGEIRDRLLVKANGVFMWAVLVIEILNKEFIRGRIFAVKKRLQEIPAKLSDLFKELLRRDSSNMADLSLCLQWILFSKRPLSREEFYFAMVSGLEPGSESLFDWNPDLTSSEDMDRFVLNSSKGLAEMTRAKRPQVQFIHESVRDFLLKENGLAELWPDIGAHFHAVSHEELKRCCKNYLDTNATRYLAKDAANSQAAKDLRKQLNARLPFLEYASRSILYHADEAAQHVSQENFLHKFELAPLINAINLVEPYAIRRNDPKTNLKYLLAEHGCARLLKTLKPSCTEIRYSQARGTRYEFPFFVALAKKHRGVVKAILPDNDDVGDEDVAQCVRLFLNSPPQRGTTPFCWALETHQQRISEALMSYFDGDIKWGAPTGRTALSLAAQTGFRSVVTVLITTHRAEVNTRDSNRRTPLSYAAQHGHETIVELLLKHGATAYGDINGTTPLQFAADEGHVKVVQQLLDHGSHLEDCSTAGCTPLLYTAAKRHVSVVRFLKDAHVDTHQKQAHKDILDKAIKVDIEVALRLLLHSKVANDFSPDVLKKSMEESLAAAIKWGESVVVQVLLEEGVDTEVKCSRYLGDSCGETALFLAIRNQQPTIIQKLLSYSANTEAVNQDGVTPLIYAAKSSDILAVQILLANGANVHAQDGNGRTALSYSRMQGHEECIRLLIEAGAHVS